MSLGNVSPGQDVPHDVNVVIEIPAHADPVKYEVDKLTGTLHVDRFISTPMRYPCNYGYVPGTHAEDGDPVDVLVITPFPLLSGSVIRIRPVGLLSMTDEAGKDGKVLAVPVDALCALYHNVREHGDLPPVLLDGIIHFFEHYKDFEVDKWVKLEGWQGVDSAKAEITEGVKRYQALLQATT